jgi:hypothetical protein
MWVFFTDFYIREHIDLVVLVEVAIKSEFLNDWIRLVRLVHFCPFLSVLVYF